MGSVKILRYDYTNKGLITRPPKRDEFGLGVWEVSGRFSVGDLKELIPPVNIHQKAEALTMMTARFFEWMATIKPEIPTCYVGVLDKNNKITDTTALLDKGETSNYIVMKLASTPESYILSLSDEQFIKQEGSDLDAYRKALKSGELQCGVADVESIFRHGFPLGSSTFKKIFKATGEGESYERLSTYEETVNALSKIRQTVEKEGMNKYPELEKLLAESGLKSIPDPGFVLKGIVYDSTTKFEAAGDREITKEEAKELSGLDEEGYELWTKEYFPTIAQAQIKFCDERGILNIDGKAECVAYKKKPVVTDFLCTSDENRLMIIIKTASGEWAIPSNKEIQRAIFREAGVYSSIEIAKARSKKENNLDNWRSYLPKILQENKIDLNAVSEHSCNLMGYAIAEVANRILEKEVFETKHIDLWSPEFIPYASRIKREGD